MPAPQNLANLNRQDNFDNNIPVPVLDKNTPAYCGYAGKEYFTMLHQA